MTKNAVLEHLVTLKPNPVFEPSIRKRPDPKRPQDVTSTPVHDVTTTERPLSTSSPTILQPARPDEFNFRFSADRRVAPVDLRSMGLDSRSADRLEFWQEIAAYLDRDTSTVRRWEKQEGLPVHRHVHQKQASVYAYHSEIDGWLESRRPHKTSSKGFGIAVLPLENLSHDPDQEYLVLGMSGWRRHSKSANPLWCTSPWLGMGTCSTPSRGSRTCSGR